jgi:CheY-like chemotaxis protein
MKKRVVVIEDDEAINDILSIMLTNYGYVVSSVRIGEHLTYDDKLAPDLFVIDRNLPGVDGISLCRELKSRPGTSHIPVIMISASPGFVEPARAAGADACIEKPFSRVELFSIIDKYVDKNSS